MADGGRHQCQLIWPAQAQFGVAPDKENAQPAGTNCGCMIRLGRIVGCDPRDALTRAHGEQLPVFDPEALTKRLDVVDRPFNQLQAPTRLPAQTFVE